MGWDFYAYDAASVNPFQICPEGSEGLSIACGAPLALNIPSLSFTVTP